MDTKMNTTDPINYGNRAKRVYHQNDTNETVVDAIKFSHPGFRQDYYFINKDLRPDVSIILKDENGNDQEFYSLPFFLSLPSKGDNNQDVTVTFPVDSVYDTFYFIEEIQNAQNTDTETLIKMKFYSYVLEVSDEPQNKSGVLEISQITTTNKSIVAQAQRRNLYNEYIGRDLFDYRFEGLWL